MPETSSSAIAAATARWRAELVAATGRDALVDYQDLPVGTLDLATAHPSGLAQFLAGRPTRLSELFREAGALAAARRRARAIRLAAVQLGDQHGVGGSYLASGMVSWGQGDGRVQAPVLLRPLTLKPRGGGQVDDDLDLDRQVRLNPSLVRALARSGVRVDGDQLVRLAAGEHGFNPRPVLAAVREAAGHLPGFELRERTVIGVFVDVVPALLAELEGSAEALQQHGVAAALVQREADLADDDDAGRRDEEPRPLLDDAGLAPLAVPFAVLDLDADQRRVLQAVADGRSVRVSAPPGSGATRLLTQLVVTQAGLGRRTLLVASQRVELAGVVDGLAALGLGGLVVRPDSVPTSASREGPPAPLRWEGAATDDSTAPSATAAEALRELAASRAALHRVAQPWGISVSQALHALARLSSGPDAPRTTVRLDRDAAAKLTGTRRQDLTALLRRLADLGGFEAAVEAGPWHGAHLASADEARQALETAHRLATESLPHLRSEMTRIATTSGLSRAKTVADCGRQIDLLIAVRTTLDTFIPNVYERSVADLVNATASRQWREDRGIRMPTLERRRWRRQARELLRPGSQPADLSAALQRAQAERAQWQEIAAGGGWPRVPAGLAAADDAYQAVRAELQLLDPVLASTPAEAGLATLPLDDLGDRLERLANDDKVSATLPERVALVTRLRDTGLARLLDDLLRRRVPAARVADELELCWWASVLEQILATTPAGSTGTEAVRRFEQAQSDAYESAAESVRAGRPVEASCTVASPLALPQVLSGDDQFDLVVVAGAHLCGVPEGVLAMARGAQVLVVGDPHGLPPASLDPAKEWGATSGSDADVDGDAGRPAEAVPVRTSVLQATCPVLPTLELTHQHRMPAQLAAVCAVPPRWAVPAPESRLRLEVVPDGSAPLGEEGVVESVDAEVLRVVALVLEHARTRSDQSLAVLTVTRHHARRIADAVRAGLSDHPDLARFFTTRWSEPFVVTDLSRCEDAVRDAVLLSVGFGKTPHGRIVHRFGPLDQDGGSRGLAVAASRARRSMTVVSCFTADDLDAEKLRTAGAQSLRTLLATAARAPDLPIEGDDVHLDPLLDDLVKRLEHNGLRARPAQDRPGFPDLVLHSDQGTAVAVLTDSRWVPGADERQVCELVLDDLSIASHLRRFGWQVVRLSSLDLFTDAEAAVAAILDAARADHHDG